MAKYLAVVVFPGNSMDDRVAECRLERIEQLPAQLSVRVCGRSLKLHDLLNWVPGTVLHFEQDATSPLQLRIGEKSIGEGEAVKIDAKFGLRVKRIGGEN